MADFYAGVRNGHVLVRGGHLINEEIIEDFESGSVTGRYTEYSGQLFDVNANAALFGNYGLEFTGGVEMWTRPTDNSVPYYPRDHDTIEYWFRPRALNLHQYWFLICQQSASSNTNRYQIEAIMGDGGFRIRKDSGGNRTILDSGSVGTWSTSNWYRVRVRLQSNATAENPQGIEVQIRRRQSGGSLTNPIDRLYTSDTELIREENGFGFRSDPSSHVYWDHVSTTSEGIEY